MVLYCRELGVWYRTDYSSMGPLCGLRLGAKCLLDPQQQQHLCYIFPGWHVCLENNTVKSTENFTHRVGPLIKRFLKLYGYFLMSDIAFRIFLSLEAKNNQGELVWRVS